MNVYMHYVQQDDNKFNEQYVNMDLPTSSAVAE